MIAELNSLGIFKPRKQRCLFNQTTEACSVLQTSVDHREIEMFENIRMREVTATVALDRHDLP